MVRLTVILLSAILLVACGTTPVKLRTEVQEVYKPVLYCPAPNWQELDRPTLLIDEVTQDMPAGEVVKRYKGTIIQLQGYSDRLRRTLEQYDSTSDAYEELKREFEEKQKQDSSINPDQ